jgi:hypothetical protein
MSYTVPNFNNTEDCDYDIITVEKDSVMSSGIKNGYHIFKYDNGDVYEGMFKDDFKHGKGILKSSNGDVYEGMFKDNYKHGKGVMTIVELDNIYSGCWESDCKHGYGIESYGKESVYEGNFRFNIWKGKGNFKTNVGVELEGTCDEFEGEFDGDFRFGLVKFANGDCYFGEYKDGKLHGEGSLIKRKDGNEKVYKGIFKEGLLISGKIFLTDKNIFDGEWNFDLELYNGIFSYDNGEKYIGEMNIDLKKHGKGMMMFKNGYVYDGEWKNDVQHGKGIYKTVNTYDGNFENGEFCSGFVMFKSGDTYDGMCKNDKFHGRGIYTIKKNDNNNFDQIFDGEFVNGFQNGYGTAKFSNNTSYEGMFKNGLYNGYGTLNYGISIYRGMFKNGKRCGKGWYMTIIGGNILAGNWEEGKLLINNKVKIIFGENMCKCGNSSAIEPGDIYIGFISVNPIYMCGEGVLTFKSGNVYEGQFSNNLFNGKGKYTFTNNSSYEGEFKDGLYHGKGILTFKDGSKYIGDFWFGKRHGRGIITNKLNEVYEGEFQFGDMHGHGKLTKANKNSYEGEFMNNLFCGNGKLTKSE